MHWSAKFNFFNFNGANMTLKIVKLHTDGSCIGNPGPGGWAAIIEYPGIDNPFIAKGGEEHTTNNKMEIMAVIEGLNLMPYPSSVIVHTDSLYVINTALGEYKRKKNLTLWEALDEAIARHRRVEWVKVAAHRGEKMNEWADSIAKQQAEKWIHKSS